MIRKRISGNNARSTYLGILSLSLILAFILVSCSLQSPNQTNLEATVFALSAQSTSLAQAATQEAQDFQATALSLQVTQLAQLVQSQSQATRPLHKKLFKPKPYQPSKTAKR